MEARLEWGWQNYLVEKIAAQWVDQMVVRKDKYLVG